MNYEYYANAIETVTGSFNDEVQKVADKSAAIMLDWRLSDKGRAEKRDKAIAELDAVTKNLSAQVRNAAADFCRDYAIKMPSDGKDHTQEIDNALRVVSMLGEGMDERNLENILAPLKTDFASMKYVLDVLDQKTKNGHYSFSVIGKVAEYLGANERFSEYADLYNQIQFVATGNDCFSCNIVSINYTGNDAGAAQNVSLRPMTTYEVLCLPDVMRKAGQMYDDVKAGTFSPAMH